MNLEKLTETVMEVVSHFQDTLNAKGFSIVFDQSLLRQAEGCLQLLELCDGDVAEVKKLVDIYCCERWWMWNHPHLDMVARRVEHLKEVAASIQGLPTSWREL
jgi:hypothetical protein